MKKILLILLSILMLTGCTSNVMTLKDGITKETTVTLGNIPSSEELIEVDEETTVTEELAGDKYIITATKGDKTEVQEFAVEFDTVDIDGTLPVDMSQFYSNPERLAKVSYVFSEDETTMTVTDENGAEPHSFNVPVNVIYPEYTIAEDITIDTYIGYEVTDFVTTEDGVNVEYELNEENSTLTITLSKNDWTMTTQKEITLINSNPYPLHYYGYDTLGRTEEDLVIQEDLTFTLKTFPVNAVLNGHIEMNDDLNGKMYFNGYPRNDFWYIEFSEDKKEAKYTSSYPRMDGGYDCTIFTLQ